MKKFSLPKIELEKAPRVLMTQLQKEFKTVSAKLTEVARKGQKTLTSNDDKLLLSQLSPGNFR